MKRTRNITAVIVALASLAAGTPSCSSSKSDDANEDCEKLACPKGEYCGLCKSSDQGTVHPVYICLPEGTLC